MPLGWRVEVEEGYLAEELIHVCSLEAHELASLMILRLEVYFTVVEGAHVVLIAHANSAHLITIAVRHASTGSDNKIADTSATALRSFLLMTMSSLCNYIY